MPLRDVALPTTQFEKILAQKIQENEELRTTIEKMKKDAELDTEAKGARRRSKAKGEEPCMFSRIDARC